MVTAAAGVPAMLGGLFGTLTTMLNAGNEALAWLSLTLMRMLL